MPGLPPLFDQEARTDARPALYAETYFHFLNRVASQFFGKARDLIEQWYSRLPDETALGLRERFRSDDERSSLGAFWELYLHELLTRCQMAITCEPKLDKLGGRPDFLVRSSSAEFYLEATAVGLSNELTAARRRQRRFYDALDKLSSPDFFLAIEARSEGPLELSGRKVRKSVQQWIESLDYDRVVEDVSPSGEASFPRTDWSADGWEASFQALPKMEEARGKLGLRPLGALMGRAFVVDCHIKIRKALADKAKAYAGLAAPFLIAVLCDGFLVYGSDESIDEELFGSHKMEFDTNTGAARAMRGSDGFFSPKSRTQVSGVLFVHHLNPFVNPRTITQAQPHLFVNPWAVAPLDLEPSFFSVSRPDHVHGQMVREEARTSVNSLLELPEGWPGPEDLRAN